MKMRTLILSVLIASPFVVSGSSLIQSDENGSQNSAAPEQEGADADDDEGDRGFDPCLLNAALAICNKQ